MGVGFGFGVVAGVGVVVVVGGGGGGSGGYRYLCRGLGLRRILHPKVHFVCSVTVMPAQTSLV